LQTALGVASQKELALIEMSMRQLLNTALRQNGSKPFGICRTCRHFEPRAAGGSCMLLRVELDSAETEQICHEHDPA
jgi:hypothetical protein